MSAEMLREAAKVLRERAEDVGRAPWSVTHIDSSLIPTCDRADEWLVMGCFDGDPRNPAGPFGVCDWEPSAAYIATMHPGVGLALADWLYAEASQIPPGATHYGPGLPISEAPAVRVARAILGGDA